MGVASGWPSAVSPQLRGGPRASAPAGPGSGKAGGPSLTGLCAEGREKLSLSGIWVRQSSGQGERESSSVLSRVWTQSVAISPPRSSVSLREMGREAQPCLW